MKVNFSGGFTWVLFGKFGSYINEIRFFLEEFDLIGLEWKLALVFFLK